MRGATVEIEAMYVPSEGLVCCMCKVCVVRVSCSLDARMQATAHFRNAYLHDEKRQRKRQRESGTQGKCGQDLVLCELFGHFYILQIVPVLPSLLAI